MDSSSLPLKLRSLARKLLSDADLVRQYTYAGHLLATARDRLGLTQAEIGRLIGLSEGSVCKMEKPPQAPSASAPKDPWPHVPSSKKMQQYAALVDLDFCALFPRDPTSPMAQLEHALVAYPPETPTLLVRGMQVLSGRSLEPGGGRCALPA